MVQRFVFVKLRDGEVAERASIASELARDLEAAGAAARVGIPADDSAARWDLSVVIDAASLAAWHALARAPAVARALDALAARAHVIKAWTFQTAS